jgi:isopenicillin-N N-acyltransferase like protein
MVDRMKPYVFRSTETDPRQRGITFGAAHATRIVESIRAYEFIYSALVGRKVDFHRDLTEPGLKALAVIRTASPDLCEEIEGMAEGAGLNPAVMGALNARTEILASLRAKAPGECSVVIHIDAADGKPIALQNWDWFEPAADNWFIWEIPHRDGSLTTTFTEFGMVGKIGINSHGLGVLFTILRHGADGGEMGLPVHVVARHVMDNGTNITRAMRWLTEARVSASSSINLVSVEAGQTTAVSVELFPGGPGFVFPDDHGVLVRTNHFLTPSAADQDQVSRSFPDTLLRRDILRRRLAKMPCPALNDVVQLMTNRVGGEFAVCARPEVGQVPPVRKTAATVVLDLEARTLRTVDPHQSV